MIKNCVIQGFGPKTSCPIQAHFRPIESPVCTKENISKILNGALCKRAGILQKREDKKLSQ